jgi:hypothetical protein
MLKSLAFAFSFTDLKNDPTWLPATLASLRPLRHGNRSLDVNYELQ